MPELRERLAVRPEDLRRRLDPATLPFATTAEVAPVKTTIGQPRAAEALAFGLETKVLFDQVNFVANTELRSVLGATVASPEQVEKAVAINEDARLRALQASFLIVGGVSLLAVFPAARLPKYVPGELSAEDMLREADDAERP